MSEENKQDEVNPNEMNITFMDIMKIIGSDDTCENDLYIPFKYYNGITREG